MRCVSNWGSKPLLTVALSGFLSLISSPALSSDLSFEDGERYYEHSMKDEPESVLPDHWPDHWYVTANTAYADVILDYDENITSKAIDQLIFRQSGRIKNKKVYVSGLFKTCFYCVRFNLACWRYYYLIFNKTSVNNTIN